MNLSANSLYQSRNTQAEMAVCQVTQAYRNKQSSTPDFKSTPNPLFPGVSTHILITTGKNIGIGLAARLLKGS